MASCFLTGKNIYLRALQESDLAGNYPSWFNDQEVCLGNSHGRFPVTPEKCALFIKELQLDKNRLVLAIIERDGDVHVGNISLQGIQWIERSAEYAILMGEKSSWGKGYAREASDLILKHGFLELNLNRIYCGTFANNTGMLKLAAALGMKEEGRRRQAAFKNGKFQDVVEFGLLRDEFLKSAK